jgi:NADH dehydrogenase [ubiquinone] 1 alpha subcomplex assembly factor 7
VPEATPLERELAALIGEDGPMGVARYMALCLGHPRHGYYTTRDPFGQGGDFTTAPEISQMFGELIGLWAAESWAAMGSPAAFALVEFGPGRGTLMADALRALRVVPACRAAVSVHLVETSPVLAAMQRERLAETGVPVAWHASLDDLPPGPAVMIANEFLDALPVRQFVGAPDGWHERLIGLDTAGAPEPGIRAPAEAGAILEVGEAALSIVRHIAERLVSSPGAALFIDYGHTRSGLGDTLQAMHRHRFVSPLAMPGEADLTVHVDFAAMARAAAGAGALVHGPITQGAFLEGLGIRARAAALARKAPDAAADLMAALDRLVGEGAGEMGALFKVLALSSPDLGTLPALPRAGTGTLF